MFENLIGQAVSKNIIKDISSGTFPGAVLFSGPQASGKLTAALEVARVLSCTSEQKGLWTCECSSCQKNKAMSSINIMLLGNRDCSLEYSASKDVFLEAVKTNASYLTAARYLYLRSIRKLTLRFNQILWNGNSQINKIGSLIETINESLEILDFPNSLPDYSEIEKLCTEINSNCLKLETDYLYSSIPIDQIRNMEDWARVKPENGKKTVIIENADNLLPGVKNAILKILEEPPADCIFILLTTKKNAVLPTILSRVRNYSFVERSNKLQSRVVKLVFHKENTDTLVTEYLLNYLPVPATRIRAQADDFINKLSSGKIPDPASVIKECKDFKPRIELKLFLQHISKRIKVLYNTPKGCEAAVLLLKVINQAWENVTLYNQTATSALELLIREINKINIQNGKILRCITN